VVQVWFYQLGSIERCLSINARLIDFANRGDDALVFEARRQAAAVVIPRTVCRVVLQSPEERFVQDSIERDIA
jgi:hypothetical protein